MMSLMKKLKIEDRPTIGNKHLKIVGGLFTGHHLFLCFSVFILMICQSLCLKNFYCSFVSVVVMSEMTLGFLLRHSFYVPLLCLVVLWHFLFCWFYG